MSNKNGCRDFAVVMTIIGVVIHESRRVLADAYFAGLAGILTAPNGLPD
jgi:hypothetical protein